jgi:hypothetical protein
MSKFNFTQGPWYPDNKGSIWRRDPEDLYENGGTVAGDHPLCIVSTGPSRWEKKYPMEANARLISCAPEMLDALIIKSRCKKCIQYPHYCHKCCEVYSKDLIEKATGMNIDEVLK